MDKKATKGAVKNKRATSASKTKGRAKVKKISISEAIVNIHTTYNNTIVTVATLDGKTVAWESAGTLKYRGTKKSTPFVARQIVEKLFNEKLKGSGLKKISIVTKGRGPGRMSCLKTIKLMNYDIISIKNVTPIPFNGCRLRKRELKTH